MTNTFIIRGGMDTWVSIIIYTMGDKGADIPCTVATVTNNIIPTGVRWWYDITRLYVFVYFNKNLYRCQEKKTRIRVKSLRILWLA